MSLSPRIRVTSLSVVFAAHYPPVDVRGPLPLPAWVATYERVKLAGLIPAVPVTTMRNGNPAYDAGVDMRQACSWTVGQCYNPYDVVDAPRGVFAVAFDVCASLCSRDFR